MRTDAYPEELPRAEIARSIGEEPARAVEYFGKDAFTIPPEDRPPEELRDELVGNLHLIEAAIIGRIERDGVIAHIESADYDGCTDLRELADRQLELVRAFFGDRLDVLAEEGFKPAIRYADDVLWALSNDPDEKTLRGKFGATLEIASRTYEYGLRDMLGEAREQGFTDTGAFMAAAERSDPVFTFIAGHAPHDARELLNRLRGGRMVRLEADGDEPRFVLALDHGKRGACPALWGSGLIPDLYRSYLRRAESLGIVRQGLTRKRT